MIPTEGSPVFIQVFNSSLASAHIPNAALIAEQQCPDPCVVHGVFHVVGRLCPGVSLFPQFQQPSLALDRIPSPP